MWRELGVFRLALLIIIFGGTLGILIMIYGHLMDPGFTTEGGAGVLPDCLQPTIPIGYRIGRVDPRFGITREKIKDLVQAATLDWQVVAERELFVPDPHAPLTINLVYDKRESDWIRYCRLITKLDELSRKMEVLLK